MSAQTPPSATNGNELSFNIYGYNPALAAAIVFLVTFGLITLWQTGLVVRSRIWWLAVLLVGGVCEIIGWVGRAWAARNPYSLNAFLMQQICLVLAPCFFSATIYGLLGMVVRSLGRQYSYLRPSLYLWLFCVADLVAIVVQAVGGAMAALALQNDKSSDAGTHIMVAGVVIQLACMVVFSVLALDVYRRTRNDKSYRDRAHAQEGRLERLGWALGWSTAWIIIRGIYRSIELAQGWSGYLITHEPYFAVLDSTAMVLCQAVFCFAWPAKEKRAEVGRRESRASEKTVAPSAGPGPETGEKVQSV